MLVSVLVFIGAILGALAFFRLSREIKRIDRLETKVNELTAQLAHRAQKSISNRKDELTNVSVVSPAPASERVPTAQLQPHVQKSIPRNDGWTNVGADHAPSPEQLLPAQRDYTPQKQSDFAKTHVPVVPHALEKFFLWLKDNWAGFAGVGILVLGITFGTVYLSFFAGPFIRFLLLIAIGLAFLGVALYIRNNPLLRELSSWLQSASGAIILYSVLATAFLPALHFYQSPTTGLFLLSLGLTYNLLLAYFAPKEAFASFHVLISLIALMVVPKDLTVLIAASVVALAGISLSVRHAWNTNLFISFVSFSIFHIIWFQSQNDITPVALYGVVCASLVGTSALLAHYQNAFHQKMNTNNLFTHITIWLFLAVQLAQYNLGFTYLFIPLGLATIACFSLCLYAKRKGMNGLFSVDAVVGQVLATVTILSLTRVNLPNELIVWLAFVQALSFTTLTYGFRQFHLSKIGAFFMGGATIWLSIVLVELMPQSSKIVMIAIITLAPLYFTRCLLINKTQENDSLASFEGFYPNIIDLIFFALAFMTLVIAISGYPFGYMSFIAVLMVMTLNKKLMNQENHKLFYLGFATLSVIFSWTLIPMAPSMMTALLFCGLPPLVLLGVMLVQKTFYIENNVCFEDLWVYLVGIHIAVLCALILGPISAFLPGVSYLIFGVIFFEGAMLLNAKSENLRAYIISVACKNMALLFLLGYCLLYMLLYLPSEATLFNYASLSQVLTLMAIILSVYWYFSKPILQSNHAEHSWRISVKALTISEHVTFDIAFVLSIFLLITSFSAPIHPIGYGLIGLVFSAPFLRSSLPPRAMLYAVGLLMATCAQVAIVSSKWASPLSDWYHDTHITGPISLVLAIGIASFLLNRPSNFNNKLIKLYYQNPVLTGLLPIFISLGLFLMWRFDKAYLTMLWVVEIVAIVMLGFILKSKKLVQLALLFLIFCVGRLIVYDLAQTALIVKAMVFIVVGLLMILIHVIYKKYASRLA